MPDNFVSADPLNPYKDYDEAKLLAFLKSFKQKTPGPYPHSYSNLGMGLLGHLIATKLNGLDYATYLHKNLTGPLGLNDTKTALDTVDIARAAQGYGNFFNLMPFWDLNVLEPAGVLKTTVNDLLKYVRFNMVPGNDDLGQAANLAQTPRADADAPDQRIGLAWFSVKLGTHSVVTHSGATGGYRANLIFDRENKLGYVELSNTDMAPNCLGSAVFAVKIQ